MSRSGSSPRLLDLVAEVAPYWGGELEICTAYFESPARDARSDRVWLARQCHKELFDGTVPALRRITADLAGLGRTADASDLARQLHAAAEELHHFGAFAALYAELAGGDEPMSFDAIETRWGWPANDALRELRVEHRRQHGWIGMLAQQFTEGGGGALYLAGSRLAGRGGIDDRIAQVCADVLVDERGHVLESVTGTAAGRLAEHDWTVLRDLAVAQLRLRLRMRNDQLGAAVPEGRLVPLEQGLGDPLTFDWAGAGFASA